MTKLRQITGEYIELDIISDAAKAHFENPRNYTKEILEEWEGLPFEGLVTPEDKVILDIGANVGLFTYHVLPYAQRIVRVEPTPQHNLVRHNLDLGFMLIGFDTVVSDEQSALNSYTGKCNFRVEPVNTTMNTIRDGVGAFEVDCITLQDLCAKYALAHVDLCKVDIEGSERQAITIETVKPVSNIIKKFLLETHPRSREEQDHFKAIFEQCGYTVEYPEFNGSVYAYKI